MAYPMKLRQLNLYRVSYKVQNYTDTRVVYIPGFSTRHCIEIIRSEHERPSIKVLARAYKAKLVAPLGYVLA